jgi:hypothetical protein
VATSRCANSELKGRAAVLTVALHGAWHNARVSSAGQVPGCLDDYGVDIDKLLSGLSRAMRVPRISRLCKRAGCTAVTRNNVVAPITWATRNDGQGTNQGRYP